MQGRYNTGSDDQAGFMAWSAMHSGLITANDIWEDRQASTSSCRCATRSAPMGVRCEFKNANDPFGRPSQYFAPCAPRTRWP
ncbi:MAG: hypothetical protein R2713_02485 [Ilumatobacteraceae bacterium]